ncbi:MAG: gamma-glutamyl-gamma-aminobutyrate hydrolase family protein, partial [Planctomycetota bacterium]
CAVSRFLIVRTGSTAPRVRAVHGDYDRWFTDALAGRGLTFGVCDATAGAVPPPAGHTGVIITGSTSAAYRREAWMDGLSDLARRAERAGVPVLAVCFAAQWLARARGGHVILNPHGWQIGGVPVELTREGTHDPLFAGLPARLRALATHEDRIERLPPGAVLLASSPHTPVEAFRAGDRLWGVQFHPELSAAIAESLIRMRSGELARDARAHGLDPDRRADGPIETVRHPEAEQARKVLDNFIEVCLRGSPAVAEPPR